MHDDVRSCSVNVNVTVNNCVGCGNLSVRLSRGDWPPQRLRRNVAEDRSARTWLREVCPQAFLLLM